MFNIARDNLPAAARIADLVDEKLNWIAEVDFTGSPSEGLPAGVRRYNFKNVAIFYRSDETAIRVLRVKHQRQNITPDDFAVED